MALAESLTALHRFDAEPPENLAGRPLATRDTATRDAIAKVGDAFDTTATTDLGDAALTAPHGTVTQPAMTNPHLGGTPMAGCASLAIQQGINDVAGDRDALGRRTPGLPRNRQRPVRAPDPARWCPANTPHDIRHSYATIALHSGVHPKIGSSRLRHSRHL